MAKVVLLTPPLGKIERMGALREGGAVMPGLGILYISAHLRRLGHQTSIVDAEGLRLDMNATVAAITRAQPELLGIGATSLSLWNASEVAKQIKEQCPGLKVFLGGPHVTALPHQTMAECPHIDGCILGDGEISFGKLADNIASGRPFHQDVDGLIFRDGDQVLLNPKTTHLADLDSLPFPAFDLLDGFPKPYRPPFHSYRRLPVANIVTSRGCPGACSFCDRSVFGTKTFLHSIDYVIEMIAWLVRDFGIKEISIKDDMFLISYERVAEFCDKLRRSKLDVIWSCNARVNSVSDDMLRIMKQAGCWMISYGIESGSPKMLKKMLKGITTHQIHNALALTRKNGIVSKGFYMLGIPGETEESLQATLRSLDTLPLDEISVNFYTPFPGSRLYNEVLKEGFLPDFRAMSMQNVVYVPHGLDAQTLQLYQRKMIRSFYLRPGKLVNLAVRGLTDLNEFKRILRMGKMFVSWFGDHG